MTRSTQMRMGIGIVVGALLVALPAGVALYRSIRPAGETTTAKRPGGTERPDTGQKSSTSRPAEPTAEAPAESPPEPTTQSASAAPSSSDRPRRSVPKTPESKPAPPRSPQSASAGKPPGITRPTPPPTQPPLSGDATSPLPPGLPDLPTDPPDAADMTELSGQHLGGLILRAGKSPYLLTGRCEVLGPLEVEPGVALWVLPKEHPNAKLVVQGPVRAIGRADAPIVLAAAANDNVPAEPPPTVLESTPVSTSDAPEGWELAYLALSNASMIANQRAARSRIRFAHVRGELRVHSQAGNLTLEDSWFAGPNDLLLEAETVTARRILVADTRAEYVKKFFIATAGRINVTQARIDAVSTRLLTREHPDPELVLRDNLISATQLTVRLADGCRVDVASNNFLLRYRPQVVGRRSDHPDGVDLGGNYWEIRSPESDWPHLPRISPGQEILNILDQPKRPEPVAAYRWPVESEPKPD